VSASIRLTIATQRVAVMEITLECMTLDGKTGVDNANDHRPSQTAEQCIGLQGGPKHINNSKYKKIYFRCVIRFMFKSDITQITAHY